MANHAEQDRRVNFLEQQIKDLEQHLRNECETSVKRQFQLMQQVADLGKRLQLKEAATNYLQQQLNEALGAYRAQRQRADQLQLESGSKAEQNQREQALREHIQRQEQQIREQQAALSECTSRSFEQQKIHERLQRSAELLEMRREDENVVSAEERAHLDDQLAEVQQQSDVLSDTCNQEGSDAALQNDTDEGQNPMTNGSRNTVVLEQEDALLDTGSQVQHTNRSIRGMNFNKSWGIRAPTNGKIWAPFSIYEYAKKLNEDAKEAQVVGHKPHNCSLV
ncbi:hypothetical protein PC118_g10598 [Phytophthora cactorum]|uniref:Uncharacterized protein n=2 Tax=Phytophthora cactorum TaxID=29920 RepID=A0A8T1FTD6_9STRA|nr:hypothetical protein PC118_g10598 [Phytophthora cactorum]